MTRGDKSSYSDKQKRQAAYIKDSYEERGASHKTAESRAWATVNKLTHGGKTSGSGRGKAIGTLPAENTDRTNKTTTVAKQNRTTRPRSTRTRKSTKAG